MGYNKRSNYFEISITLILIFHKSVIFITLSYVNIYLQNSKKPNPVLFKATLRITNFEQCNASYAGQLKSHMFCAKGEKQDSCQGKNSNNVTNLN